ncbi:hypothetical protein ABIB40_003412 [Pedobacter sp. UYP30]
MRKIRSELTEQFLQDKEKYLKYIRKVMEYFKSEQNKI